MWLDITIIYSHHRVPCLDCYILDLKFCKEFFFFPNTGQSVFVKKIWEILADHMSAQVVSKRSKMAMILMCFI